MTFYPCLYLESGSNYPKTLFNQLKNLKSNQIIFFSETQSILFGIIK